MLQSSRLNKNVMNANFTYKDVYNACRKYLKYYPFNIIDNDEFVNVVNSHYVDNLNVLAYNVSMYLSDKYKVKIPKSISNILNRVYK